MDRHVAPRQARGLELVETASLLAMTNKKRFIGLTTKRLGVRLGSRNDRRNAVCCMVASKCEKCGLQDEA
jgi:hypothetical protein